MGTNDSFDSYYKNLENNGSELDSSNNTPPFEFLQSKEKPKSPSRANQTATLTVKADTDVWLYCDGEFVDEFEANKVKKTTIPTGQHILTIESAQYDDITEDREIDASDPNKTYTLLVKDMKVKEEERQKADSDKWWDDLFRDGDRKSETRVLWQAEEESELDAETLRSMISPPEEGFELLEEMNRVFHKYAELLARRDVDHEVREIEYMAEKGFVEYQVLLGYYYEQNERHQKNLDKARKWYRKAANNGDAFAQVQLEEIS